MKKGFTLVEVLAVIVVLGILAAISFPIITDSINSAKKGSQDTQERIIVDAAKKWANDYSYLLSDEVDDTYLIQVSTLQRMQYLSDGDIVNLKNSEVLTNACVEIKTKEHKYEYKFIEECSGVEPNASEPMA